MEWVYNKSPQWNSRCVICSIILYYFDLVVIIIIAICKIKLFMTNHSIYYFINDIKNKL
jgi:hypothetical protein